MSNTPQPTPYHDSVDGFRRGLMTAHLDMVDRAEHYMNAKLARTSVAKSETVSDAWMASVAAYNTTYALAAVLGVAEKEFGPEVAHRLACIADDLMANGDEDPGHNADVTPEKEEATS